jgi:hypothetical protein
MILTEDAEDKPASGPQTLAVAGIAADKPTADKVQTN